MANENDKDELESILENKISGFNDNDEKPKKSAKSETKAEPEPEAVETKKAEPAKAAAPEPAKTIEPDLSSYTPENLSFESFGETEAEATIDMTAGSGTVTVQPVEFMSFENDQKVYGEENKNLEMLLDIKLELTVELGRCELPIKKILELTRGSIIELDKIAGEPVSLFANGKHIANGEVVVIEDNFGLRITSIIDPESRLKGMQ